MDLIVGVVGRKGVLNKRLVGISVPRIRCVVFV